MAIISKSFAYDGFSFNFSEINYFVSWVFFFIGLCLIRDRIYQVSDYFFITAFLGILIPSSVLFAYDDTRNFFPIFLLTMALIFISLITRVRLFSFRSIPLIKQGLPVIVVVSLLMVLFLVIWYFVSGVSFNLDLFKVYEFREVNAKTSDLGILAYTNNWTFQIFNVALFAIALMYRRYFLAILIAAIQVYFFAASAHKSVLFFPLMVFGIWYYFKHNNNVIVIPVIFICLITLTLATFYIFDDLLASSFLSRRIFFVPAHLMYIYFEFFSSNEHVFWSNSILSPLIKYPYDVLPAQLIGDYLNQNEMYANGGFIASGFAHAGVIGVFFYSLLLGFILRFINDATQDFLPLWFAVSLTAIPLRSVILSSDLFTVMLSHGFVIVLFIILLVRSKKYA